MNESAADANAATDSPGGDQGANGRCSQQGHAVELNIAVRVNSPGADGDVSQSNYVAANAAAGVDDGAAGTGTATATADQPSPSNVNVSVRIASPGSSGAVAQTNTASAEAADAADPRHPSRRPTCRPTSSNASNIDQPVSECSTACTTTSTGSTGPAQPSPFEARPPLPPAGSTDGDGCATDPINGEHSVRVGSPGHDDVPTQVRTVDANAASATATVSGASNVKSVVLPGSGRRRADRQ